MLKINNFKYLSYNLKTYAKFSLMNFTSSRSGKTGNFDKALKDLKTSLINEINFEKETYKQLNQKELSRFLNNSGFSFEEKNESSEMTLKKETDSFYITVYFTAKEPLEENEEQTKEYKYKSYDNLSLEDVEEYEDKLNKEEMFFENSYEFCVEIINKNSSDKSDIDKKETKLTKEGIYVIGQFFDDNIKISSLYAGDNIEKIHSHLLTTDPSNSEYFLGPKFDDLDTEFQTYFINFLSEDIGVDIKLLRMIEVLSQDKDQRLYMQWLKDVNNFLKLQTMKFNV